MVSVFSLYPLHNQGVGLLCLSVKTSKFENLVTGLKSKRPWCSNDQVGAGKKIITSRYFGFWHNNTILKLGRFYTKLGHNYLTYLDTTINAKLSQSNEEKECHLILNSTLFLRFIAATVERN